MNVFIIGGASPSQASKLAMKIRGAGLEVAGVDLCLSQKNRHIPSGTDVVLANIDWLSHGVYYAYKAEAKSRKIKVITISGKWTRTLGYLRHAGILTEACQDTPAKEKVA